MIGEDCLAPSMARHGGSGQAGQKHKTHKGGRKRQRNQEQGQVETSSSSRKRQGLKQRQSLQGKKRSRLQAAKSHREKLREQTLREKRLATHGPPKVIGLIPCSDLVDAQEAYEVLRRTASQGHAAREDEGVLMMSSLGASEEDTFCVPDVRVRLRILAPFEREAREGEGDRADPLIRLLDYVRVADVILFVARAAGPGPDSVMDPACLSQCEALRAFGLPSVYCCVQGLAGLGLAERAREKKRCAKVLTDQVREGVSCLPLDTPQDSLHLFRMLKEHKQVEPTWRRQRPYIIADGVDVTPDAQNGAGTATVEVTGYVRGQNASANQIFLLPGLGERHVDRIDAREDKFERERRIRGGGAGGGGGGSDVAMADMAGARTLARAEPSQLESVARENIPDPLAGEQTWPTEEEMREAEEAARERTRTSRMVNVKVPKGFSEYQSAWIDDEGSDELEFESSTDEEAEEMADAGDMAAGAGYGFGAGEIEVDFAEDGQDGEGDDGDDMGMDTEDEYEGEEGYEGAMERERRRRREAEDEDLDFPDEVDVPMDQPARQRFVKYRGLKSFRTSPWDPKESLPYEYARIFAFENPTRAQKQAKAKLRQPVAQFSHLRPDLVQRGTHVTLVFTGVPVAEAEALRSRAMAGGRGGAAAPYAIFGLLQHETKMSLVNFSVHKSQSYEDPLANKDELVFYTGTRIFGGRPIISDSAPNADKHRNHKFLRQGESCTFSLYAPIHHAPLPVLCFKRERGGLRLAASGLVKGSDPDRVVLKRIVLTGYPHKVHKTKAYVRYMFHNPSDVRWFQPLEVWTKYGRRGKIREPVGTHGSMKCVFDAVVQQRDTVCISLYKRVFPKWQDHENFIR